MRSGCLLATVPAIPGCSATECCSSRKAPTRVVAPAAHCQDRGAGLNPSMGRPNQHADTRANARYVLYGTRVGLPRRRLRSVPAAGAPQGPVSPGGTLPGGSAEGENLSQPAARQLCRPAPVRSAGSSILAARAAGVLGQCLCTPSTSCPQEPVYWPTTLDASGMQGARQGAVTCTNGAGTKQEATVDV